MGLLVPTVLHLLFDGVRSRLDAQWHGERQSKSISDALRWERRYGRVGRLGRGRYGPGSMPRGTEHRIHQRVLALRARAAELSLGGGQNDRSSSA